MTGGTTPAVAVVGRATDPHAAAVARMAQSKGAKVTVIDTASRSFDRWRWRDGQLVDDRGDRVAIDAAYIRSVAVPLPVHDPPVVGGRDMAVWLAAAEDKRRRHLQARTLHAGLEAAGVFVVNSVETTWFHRSKPAADLRLRAAGLPAPRSLVTDDPAEVRAFVDAVGAVAGSAWGDVAPTSGGEVAEEPTGGVVRKPIGGGGECVAVGPGDLTDAALAGLATAPALFQEEIRGQDLRVYVLDGEVVAGAYIKTTAVDYRGHEDEVVALDVDDELGDLCLRSAATLGMVFTGIDVKRGADGTLTVLDVNPSPMFLGIERRTGQPIADRLAAKLVTGPTSEADKGRGAEGRG